MRLQVLTATSMKMAVFWDVGPCSLTDVSEVLTASIIRAMIILMTEQYTLRFCIFIAVGQTDK
jgi:hypothetical protein